MKVGKYLKRMREKKSYPKCKWIKDKHAIKLTEFLDIVEKLKIKSINPIFREKQVIK